MDLCQNLCCFPGQLYYVFPLLLRYLSQLCTEKRLEDWSQSRRKDSGGGASITHGAFTRERRLVQTNAKKNATVSSDHLKRL